MEAIQIGWSWPAFFFSAIWAFVKRMWGITFLTLFSAGTWGFLLRSFGFPYLGKSDIDLILVAGALIICFVFGAKGSSWRDEDLLDRGFCYSGTVTATEKDVALALYLESNRVAGTLGVARLEAVRMEEAPFAAIPWES